MKKFYLRFIFFSVLIRRSIVVVALLSAAVSSSVSSATEIFSLDYPQEPERLRGTSWPVLGSFLLPGLDQWVEGQTASAAIYTTYAIAGLSVMGDASDRLEGKSVGQDEIDSRDNDVRQAMVGGQMYQTAGALSAFHAYRSAANTWRQHGQFDFLPKEETTADLITAPFEFSFLTRPTTYLPLGGLLLVSAVMVKQEKEADMYLTGSDAGYLTAISYQAGVSEEAVFRGVLMPSLHNNGYSEVGANTFTAVLFGLAHYSDENPIPWPQALVGYYLGAVTIQNHWSLRESIFIHAWWDVVAFAASYLADPAAESRQIRLPQLVAFF